MRELPGLKKGEPELIVPRHRRRIYPHLVHRPRALEPADVTTLDAIPVTTVARTLIDLATCVDAEVLEEALDDALRRRLVSLSRLRWRMREVGARTVLRTMVGARAAGVPESVLETRFLRLMREAGLPKPVVQHQVGRFRVDFAYPDALVAVETEGFAWHSSHRQLERDAARRNALTLMGWTVLHFTWEKVNAQPDQVVQVVRMSLRDRRSTGWSTSS